MPFISSMHFFPKNETFHNYPKRQSVYHLPRSRTIYKQKTLINTGPHIQNSIEDFLKGQPACFPLNTIWNLNQLINIRTLFWYEDNIMSLCTKTIIEWILKLKLLNANLIYMKNLCLLRPVVLSSFISCNVSRVLYFLRSF